MRRARSMSRLRVVALLGLSGLLIAGTSSGSDQREVPVDSIFTNEVCLYAARAAGSDHCDVTANASASSRAVSADNHLVSPYYGRAAWKAQSGSTSQVVATHELTEPVEELEFVVKMRVNRASARLSGDYGDSSLANYVESLKAALVDQHLGRSAAVRATAMALHAECSDCGGGNVGSILHTDQPGTTVKTSGEEIVLPLTVSRAGGEDLPPGEITVRAGVHTSIWQGNSWGNDAASVDAVVKGIFLK